MAIDGNIPIQQLIENYPQLVEVLITDYGFYCFNCFAAQFETLEEGAKMHGIEGVDLDELLSHLNSLLE